MRTIVVADWDGNFNVEAALYKDYGTLWVTRIDKLSYAVTHAKTGMKVQTFTKLASAKAAAEAWKGFDWNVTGKKSRKLRALHDQIRATPEYNS